MSDSPRTDEMIILCADCEVPLVMDFSVPFKEWRCPKCGEFTEFFDRHRHAKYSDLSDAQKEYLK